MSGKIVTVLTATIAINEALSDVIDFRGVSAAQIEMPAGWTAADLGFHTSASRDGTFAALQDSTGSNVEATGLAADDHVALPAGLIGAAFVKLWSQTSGSGVNQAAARAITVILTS